MSVPPDDVVPPPPPHDEAPSVGAPTAEERQWAMFAHLSALIGGLLTGHWLGIGCFLAPLRTTRPASAAAAPPASSELTKAISPAPPGQANKVTAALT